MADLQSLSDAQVVLLAAQFIADVEIDKLQTLAAERRDVLTNDRIYRLLITLYPNDETARAALLSLLRTIDTNFSNVSPLDNSVSIETSTIGKLPPDHAAREATRLLVQGNEEFLRYAEADRTTAFIMSWCHHIESSDGSLEDVLPLAKEFAPLHPALQEWAEAYLLPVARLQYQNYPDDEDLPTLHELENASGPGAIQALLRCAQKHSSRANIARDLQEVVLPWIQGTVRSGSQQAWQDLNIWILSTSLNDFDLAIKALLEWSPPLERSGLVSRYAQTGLAVLYASRASSNTHLQACERVLHRMAAIAEVELPQTDINTAILEYEGPLRRVTETELLANTLLLESNVLTRVSESSSNFLAGILRTTGILLKYKIYASISEIALVCLTRSEERQKQEVRRILQQIPKLTSAMPAWHLVREQLLWLHSWSDSSSSSADIGVPTFLSQVPFQQIDEKLLDCILAQGNHNAVQQIYIEAIPPPLPLSVIEDRIVAAVYFAYDNASNGNRTRGGMKRAQDILLAFKHSFPASDRLHDVDHLIRATHSLSFYPLTLQHGVPFRPVNIRAQQDPLSLIGKALEQDSRAYTKLDDLLEIGRSLILAHLQRGSAELEDAEGNEEEKINKAQHEITYLAITSALAAHDFDTAYSYITTRLSLSPGSDQITTAQDDTSWRAAYAAGRYRPNSAPKLLHERIAGLSKRMDLLSLALTLAPDAEPLSEILGQWRRCEEEMDNLKSQALDEERAFEMRSKGGIPGGFGMEDDRERDADETRQALAKRSMAGSSATYEEQAPMSLFGVASGAARALSRSTQGLRGGSLKDLKIRDSQSTVPRPGATSPEGNEAGRVRKRDMVSNMVTTGLVSGMGWVLGAQPAEKEKEEYDDYR